MTLREIEDEMRLVGEFAPSPECVEAWADALKAERERIEARLLSFDLHLDKPCECTHNRNALHVCCDCGGPLS